MSNKLLYRIHISGNVQGVGFRWCAANEACIRNITGFVRNQPDGTVYIEAEGYTEQLEDFIEWCKKGPSHGFVESVDIDTTEPVNYTEFRIQH